MKARESKIDAAIRVPGLRGAVVRIGGVLVIYLLVTVLPQIFSYMATHAKWNALSETQLARHHSIEVIFRAIVFLTIAVELVRAVLGYLRQRRHDV
ncbi:hypothetical protein [Ralstonia holmesii]|uniref:hypothetical protein n=1 Tax=Ralstonia holmesii TaxID=3058602 RepID=UPI003F13FA13